MTEAHVKFQDMEYVRLSLDEMKEQFAKHIEELKKDIPQVEQNIFKAAENVTLDMILGYKDKGIQHSFLDDYENKK